MKCGQYYSSWRQDEANLGRAITGRDHKRQPETHVGALVLDKIRTAGCSLSPSVSSASFNNASASSAPRARTLKGQRTTEGVNRAMETTSVRETGTAVLVLWPTIIEPSSEPRRYIFSLAQFQLLSNYYELGPNRVPRCCLPVLGSRRPSSHIACRRRCAAARMMPRVLVAPLNIGSVKTKTKRSFVERFYLSSRSCWAACLWMAVGVHKAE